MKASKKLRRRLPSTKDLIEERDFLRGELADALARRAELERELGLGSIKEEQTGKQEK